MDGRCYLCKFAECLVTHKEDKQRKYWVRCKLDHTDYKPCNVCDLFRERKGVKGCH